MDIKKLIRKFLLEQEVPNLEPQLTRAQRELFTRLANKWRETYPEMTDEFAMAVFKAYRESLPLIKDETQPEVRSFILRGNGKYTINDLRDGNKVNIKDLLTFLKEFKKFQEEIGGGKNDRDAEEEQLKQIFSENKAKPTEKKIEASKAMWEGNDNLVINEGDFRVYSVNTREEAIRMGYYYQEKLRELVSHNVNNNKQPTTTYRHSVSPWCVVSRGDDQSINENGRMIINSVSNMYPTYRERSYGGSYFFYFVIDESKDLFGPQGNYYISTIMAVDGGGYLIASMYNGERNATSDELYNIYPQLRGNLGELVFKPFDRKKEVGDNVPKSILEIINEQEGSPNAFWMQGPDEKTAFINAGGQLKNPKSWETMTNELREQYINSIQIHDATQKIGSEEFMRAVMKSGVSWKNKLNRRMQIIGTSGIGFLADNFMNRDYRPDFFGKKNPNVRIYRGNNTNKYGIYDIDEGSWVSKDGVEYFAEFTKNILKKPESILFDSESNQKYVVVEFVSPSAKFYTLSNIKDKDNWSVFILSEKKYIELREKIDAQVDDVNAPGVDDGNDIDIGEQNI